MKFITIGQQHINADNIVSFWHDGYYLTLDLGGKVVYFQDKEQKEYKALRSLVGVDTLFEEHVNENNEPVDTVEVVRCKDCKWYGIDRAKGLYCMRCKSPAMWVDGITPLEPNDFCSYGERRKR